MTTFIFMLTPETERLLAERVLDALSNQFPEHEFEAGVADIGEFENTILPLHGTAGEVENPGRVIVPSATEVRDVRQAFQQILAEVKDWKPS